MKLKEVLEICQSYYEIINTKTGEKLNEKLYLNNKVNNLVIVLEGKKPILHICVCVE